MSHKKTHVFSHALSLRLEGLLCFSAPWALKNTGFMIQLLWRDSMIHCLSSAPIQAKWFPSWSQKLLMVRLMLEKYGSSHWNKLAVKNSSCIADRVYIIERLNEITLGRHSKQHNKFSKTWRGRSWTGDECALVFHSFFKTVTVTCSKFGRWVVISFMSNLA